jgi:hypothetical protein
MSLALKAFLREGFPKQEMSASFVPKAITQLVNFDVGKNYGQWPTLPIPRMTPFTWWNRQWEIRISTFPYMGWGLFTLQNLEAEEELIPFTGPCYTTNQYKKMQGYFPRIKCYALNAEKTFYIDGDVEKGNVAGYINSSIDRREEIENVIWEYHDVDPRPWNKKEWGYVMTRSTRPIKAGEELFAYYKVNF